MASSSSSNSWILSLKVLLISAGVVSVAMVMKLAVPLMLNFAVYDLPAIWSVIVSLLKPPYLYVIINGIIITIAASSRFQLNHHHENQSEQLVNPPSSALPSEDLTSELPSVSIQPSFDTSEHPAVDYEIEPSVMENPPVVDESEPPVIDVETVAENGSKVVGGDGDEFAISRSTWNPTQRIIDSPPPPENIQSEFSLPVREKQLVTSRFAHNRKPTKTNLEGVRALRVLKPKKHETLESTWKMITDGRHMPRTRHLRKSDSFENHLRKSDSFENLQHDRHPDESAETSKNKAVKKSETFKDRTNYENQNDRPPPSQPSSTNSSPASGGKLRKDGSLSQDELNRRVEAFIKKVNDDMRLQRQESLNQYMEMVNRGAH